jgi:hypothetical protein
MPNDKRPRFVVAPQTHAFGLFRMFQITGEHTRPLLTVVHTMDEALAELGVQLKRAVPRLTRSSQNSPTFPPFLNS